MSMGAVAAASALSVPVSEGGITMKEAAIHLKKEPYMHFPDYGYAALSAIYHKPI